MGASKSRKPELGIGMGKGARAGTGTIMWRGTDTRTRTSLALIYFSSNLILIQFIQKIRKLAWDHYDWQVWLLTCRYKCSHSALLAAQLILKLKCTRSFTKTTNHAFC